MEKHNLLTSYFKSWSLGAFESWSILIQNSILAQLCGQYIQVLLQGKESWGVEGGEKNS